METTSSFSIILVDDYLLMRQELKKIIEEMPGVQVIGEAADDRELFELLNGSSPNLVLLDISLPWGKALEATREIKRKYPEVQVLLMIIEEEQEYWTRAILAGAKGVLLKQDAATEVPRAIAQIRSGKNYLPPQLRDKQSLRDSLNGATGLLLGSFT